MLKITEQFQAGPRSTISATIVQRSLCSMGFRSRGPTQVSLLTPRFNAFHLAWDREHGHQTLCDWKRVAWLDKSRFQLFRANRRLHMWRKFHEAMDVTCQQGIIQGGNCPFMALGIFSWHALSVCRPIWPMEAIYPSLRIVCTRL